MKYIKSFVETSSWKDEIENTCKDILLPLSDNRIEIECLRPSPFFEIGSSKSEQTEFDIAVVVGDIDITRGYPASGPVFLVKDYEDEFLRLIDYMQSKEFYLIRFDFDDNGEISWFRDFGTGIESLPKHLIDLRETVYLKLYFDRR